MKWLTRIWYIFQKKNVGNFIYIDGDGNVDEPIRQVHKTFVYFCSLATISTTGGEEIEQNEKVGHVSTSMWLLTCEVGDL